MKLVNNSYNFKYMERKRRAEPSLKLKTLFFKPNHNKIDFLLIN